MAALLHAGLTLTVARRELRVELEALPDSLRQKLENVFLLAVTYGTPVAEPLEALAEWHDSQHRFQRKVELASVAPKATAKLVAWLAPASLGLGELCGLHTLSAITRSGACLVAAAFGAALLVANAKVLSHLIRRSQSQISSLQVSAGQSAELLVALAAGVPAAKISPTLLPSQTLELIRVAELTGIALTPLIRAQSQISFEQHSFEIEVALQKLQMQLLAPIGFLALPAMLLLLVVPAVAGFITN